MNSNMRERCPKSRIVSLKENQTWLIRKGKKSIRPFSQSMSKKLGKLKRGSRLRKKNWL